MATKRVDQYDTITPSGSEYLLIQNPATHPTAPLQYNKAVISAVSGGAVTSVAGKTGAVSLTKSDVGLSNVDNTADASKPVSTAQAAADALKANISGQAFTGAISATNLSGTNTGDETTSTIKTKLGVTTLSGSNTGDQDLSGYATTTALTTGLGTKANTTHTHAESDVTGLTSDLAGKQATLVSGTNIKTVNGNSLLGSGDLTLATGGSTTLAGDTDVAITSPANKDLLTYDTASSKWTNQPAGSVAVPDASTTTKGIIQLAGDLDGTATAPTVPALASKAPLAAPAFTGNATFDGTTLDIDSTNHRVGIGTAGPTSQLHMKGSAAGLTIENTTASSKSFMYLTDDVAGSNFFEFDVNGSATGNTNLLSRPSSGLLRSGAGSTGGMLFVSQAAGAPIIFATGGFTNANERMRVDSNGIVTVSSAQGSATNTVVATDHTQTLTNKNLTSGTNTFPTFNQNTTGTAANVTGTVAIDNGGTGVATLPTGILKGAGTGAITAVTAPTGSIMGTSDTQVVTNKDLTSATNSFPTTLVTLTGSQTLTNKTLTAPIISTITNTGTLTLPTTTGTVALTSSNITGTAAGITGKTTPTGAIVGDTDTQTLTNKTLTTPTITYTNNSIPAAALATSAITLGYTPITTNFTTTSTTPIQVTGLSVTVTIPAGGRRVKVTAYTSATSSSTASNGLIVGIWDGAVGTGTQVSKLELDQQAATFQVGGSCLAILSPAAGSKTYNVSFNVVNAATGTFVASATAPAFILVEAI